MANYDGSIRINTQLDTKGFNQNVNSLVSGFGKLTKLVGIAFSTAAIANFIKSSKQLYQVQYEAETKLESVMKSRLKATDEQIQAIKDLASAEQGVGVIGDEVAISGAQSMASYIKNVKSLETLVPAMNNLLVAQKGLNATTADAEAVGKLLGKALNGNESILTRYGIVLTDAQKKILKYGTEEEKVAALSEAITNSVGDMNKAFANTDMGRQQQLANAFGDLKEQVGQAWTNITSLLNPSLTTVVTKLSEITAKLVQVSAAVKSAFGIQSAQSQESVSNTEEMTEAVEDYSDAVKKATTGVDELNIISDSSTSDIEDVTAGFDASSLNNTLDAEEVDTSWLDKVIEKFEKIKDTLDPIKTSITEIGEKGLTNIFENVSSIGDSVSGMWETFTSLFDENALANVGSIANSLTTMFAEAFVGVTELVAGLTDDIFNIITLPYIENKESFKTSFSEFMSAITSGLESVSGVATHIIQSIVGLYEAHIKPFLDKVASGISSIFGVLLEKWQQYGQPFVDGLIEDCQELWDSTLKPLWDNLVEFFGTIIDVVGELWEHILVPMTEWLISVLAPKIASLAEEAKNIIFTTVKVIGAYLTGLIGYVTNTIKAIVALFHGDWASAWEYAKTAVKAPINGILGMVEALVNGVIKCVNNIVNAINKLSFDVPDWVPGIGGNKFGFNLSQVSEVKIPRLANGGITTGSTLANIGEAGREAVLPLENNLGYLEPLAEMIANKISQTVNPYLSDISADTAELASKDFGISDREVYKASVRGQKSFGTQIVM